MNLDLRSAFHRWRDGGQPSSLGRRSWQALVNPLDHPYQDRLDANYFRDFFVLRSPENALFIPLLQNLSLIHHHDIVRQVHGFGSVVSHDDRRNRRLKKRFFELCTQALTKRIVQQARERGSSSNISCGLRMIARANATLCCCQPISDADIDERSPSLQIAPTIDSDREPFRCSVCFRP